MKATPGAWNPLTKDIDFPVVNSGLSKEYRSVFGPVFRTNTQMPLCNNDGIRGAVRRLTCVREPDNANLHWVLRDNQFLIEQRIPGLLRQWTAWFSSCLKERLSSTLGAQMERNRWCDQPHIKRMLRQQTRDQIIQCGRRSLNARVKRVDYKCKTGELLPPSKYPRAIGDMTAPGSTALGYYMDWVKESFSNVFTIGSASCRFIKTPDHDVLSDVFGNLINPQGLYFCFFSDDSCLSVQCSDGVLTANLDISACDGSNFDPVFKVLKRAMKVDPRYFDDIDDAFKQCRTECVVKQVEGDEKGRVYLKPIGHVLYSGSVLTTSINNMANTLIFLHIVNKLNNRVVSKAEMRQIIVDSAAEAGYILKIDECKTHGDIQFLKHSPAIVGDKIVPYLNIGTLLRGFGTISGDLPGKRKLGLIKRAQIFNSDVIKSWKHAGNTSVRRAFSNKILDKTFNYVPPTTTWRADNSLNIPIPDEEICLRYRISTVQLDELNSIISAADVGIRVCSPIVDILMCKDYGYPL